MLTLDHLPLHNPEKQGEYNSTLGSHVWSSAYLNPSDGPVYVVCNVPEGVSNAVFRICDMNGRLIQEQPLQAGAGIAEIRPEAIAAGIYLAELRLDGIRAGQVKLALQ